MEENPIDKNFNKAKEVVSTSLTVWRFVRLVSGGLIIFGALWIIGPIVANNNRVGGYPHLQEDLLIGVGSVIAGGVLLSITRSKIKALSDKKE